MKYNFKNGALISTEKYYFLEIFEKFGILYEITDTKGKNTPYITHGEISYNDVLLAIDYCMTDKAIKKYKDRKILFYIKSEFEIIERYLKKRQQDIFSIYMR